MNMAQLTDARFLVVVADDDAIIRVPPLNRKGLI